MQGGDSVVALLRRRRCLSEGYSLFRTPPLMGLGPSPSAATRTNWRACGRRTGNAHLQKVAVKNSPPVLNDSKSLGMLWYRRGGNSPWNQSQGLPAFERVEFHESQPQGVSLSMVIGRRMPGSSRDGLMENCSRVNEHLSFAWIGFVLPQAVEHNVPELIHRHRDGLADVTIAGPSLHWSFHGPIAIKEKDGRHRSQRHRHLPIILVSHEPHPLNFAHSRSLGSLLMKMPTHRPSLTEYRDESPGPGSSDRRLLRSSSPGDNTDKQLAQATMNLEVAEASNRALLREVQEARAVVTRLSATVARSAGWEDRVAALTQERDDVYQERDAESNRVRSLEMKAVTISAKCTSMQAEIYRLLDQINDQHSPDRMGQTSMTENPEITIILEKLVADGEALKRDNAELQNLLTESRSELRALTEEVQEYRAVASPVHPGLFFRASSEDKSFVILQSQLDSGYGFEIRITPVDRFATSYLLHSSPPNVSRPAILYSYRSSRPGTPPLGPSSPLAQSFRGHLESCLMCLLGSLPLARELLNIALVDASDLTRKYNWNSDPYTYSSSVCSTNASREFLDSTQDLSFSVVPSNIGIGVWQHVEQSRTSPIESMQNLFSNSDIDPGGSTFEMARLTENLNLHRALLCRLDEIPERVELIDQVKVKSITRSGTWPSSTFRIGADGFKSSVRSFAEIGSSGWAYPSHAVVAQYYCLSTFPPHWPNSLPPAHERGVHRGLVHLCTTSLNLALCPSRRVSTPYQCRLSSPGGVYSLLVLHTLGTRGGRNNP
ncbi:hypothetical protein BS47DRAFT_1442992 [Hydnum rufescens UP504]|uniref:Uncharacterized protein n=1 Tax=Hydnum rufescens UP504 TaxID=1448309 RepID=A0A9P6DME7_9AGAM|nr:hypothetical protein BS47DRAFT_1442992 [Hydnum rufescens UP504]